MSGRSDHEDASVWTLTGDAKRTRREARRSRRDSLLGRFRGLRASCASRPSCLRGPDVSRCSDDAGSHHHCQQRYLHLLRRQPAVMAEEILLMPALLVPPHALAAVRQDDQVANATEENLRRRLRPEEPLGNKIGDTGDLALPSSRSARKDCASLRGRRGHTGTGRAASRPGRAIPAPVPPQVPLDAGEGPVHIEVNRGRRVGLDGPVIGGQHDERSPPARLFREECLSSAVRNRSVSASKYGLPGP